MSGGCGWNINNHWGSGDIETQDYKSTGQNLALDGTIKTRNSEHGSLNVKCIAFIMKTKSKQFIYKTDI